MKALKVKSSWLTESDLRLDAEFHLSDGRKVLKLIKKCPYEVLTIGEVSKDIFYGGRSKRVYVSSHLTGVPFMGSADMLKHSFISLKYISKKNTSEIEKYYLEKEWTLISRSGTIGNTIFTNEDYYKKAASEHIIRVIPNGKVKSGVLYAYLTSKFGYALMTQGVFGAVIQHIEPDFLDKLPIPFFPKSLQQRVHDYISYSAKLRSQANELITSARNILYKSANLEELKADDYEFFGSHSHLRKPAVFAVSSKSISSTTLNAFNYSERMRKLIKRIKKSNECTPLSEVIEDNSFFSTGSFPRLEIDSPRSIKLINQSDIFNIKMKGKFIARKKVKVDNLVQYGEVLIAGVGTLGESETFCRVVFANEELEGQLVSGEFIRMKTNKKIPSGYLFTWLSSEYGFRLIRSTQSGTKLCRPIQSMLYEIPVPILEVKIMKDIHNLIVKAHTLRYEALKKENEAISIIENEIQSWQK